MSEILDQVLQVGFFAATIRIAAPLLLATLGEMFSERAGVLNLGIEGIMLLGAMVGFSAAFFSGNLWLGLVAAAATGLMLGALMGFLTVTLGLSQHVSGLGVTLFTSGLAFYSYRLIFGQPSQPPNVLAFETVPLPVFADIPYVGSVLFDHFLLVYFAFLLVPVSYFLLYRTPWGLNLRTAGESPNAAASAGVSVIRKRYQGLLISGALFGVAGAYFSLAQFNAFTFGLISGRGWVCIALVVLGSWSPWRCAFAALLFGMVDALQLRLQSSGAIDIPYQFFLMLPFLITVVAMACVARSARAPAALLVPY
ncbi:MAG: ABC transporter permease, partial [Gammaproteobacteria bacterium]|nr:ABC transporter permease [Gammaproteobacteria bacterium]